MDRDKKNGLLLAELRQELHGHPELSGCEKETAKILMNFLGKHTGLELHREEGWFWALHREEGAFETAAFRADMDAVCRSDGKPFHGCGHDGHSAVLAGLGLALEGMKTGRNICLIFQPAEETGQGAGKVLERLPEELPIDEIYGFHNIPGWPLGTVLLRDGVFSCASLGLTIRVLGKQSHAAYPEQGRNPGEVLSWIVLEALKAARGTRNRCHGGDPASGRGDGALVMATLVSLREGEKKFGISPGEGEVSFTLRAARQEDLKALEGRVRAFAEKLCRKQGFGLEFSVQDEFPDTVNDPMVFEECRKRLSEKGILWEILKEPMRWSEDFGWYLKKIPGCFLGIGAGEGHPGLHTDTYEFPDALIEPAVSVLKAIAGL